MGTHAECRGQNKAIDVQAKSAIVIIGASMSIMLCIGMGVCKGGGGGWGGGGGSRGRGFCVIKL